MWPGVRTLVFKTKALTWIGSPHFFSCWSLLSLSLLPLPTYAWQIGGIFLGGSSNEWESKRKEFWPMDRVEYKAPRPLSPSSSSFSLKSKGCLKQDLSCFFNWLLPESLRDAKPARGRITSRQTQERNKKSALACRAEECMYKREQQRNWEGYPVSPFMPRLTTFRISISLKCTQVEAPSKRHSFSITYAFPGQSTVDAIHIYTQNKMNRVKRS